MWERQKVTRKNRKGRAIEKIIMRIRKEIIEKRTKIKSLKERIMMGRVRNRKEKWKIIWVYVERGINWKKIYRHWRNGNTKEDEEEEYTFTRR